MKAPSKCELCPVIHFLLTEGYNAMKIHQVSNVYDRKFMSYGCENGGESLRKDGLMFMMRTVKVGSLSNGRHCQRSKLSYMWKA